MTILKRSSRRTLANRLGRACACLVAAGVLVMAGVAHASPRPSAFPVSWELKFDHATPKRIALKLPGDTEERGYWYLPFTVTNNTDAEQEFLPVFEIVGNDGSVLRSDKNVPAGVFEAIKRRENRKFLEPLSKVTGRLLIGPDQARESVAIWPEPTQRMGSFSIYVGGLSGETAYVRKNGDEVPMRDKNGIPIIYPPNERAEFEPVHKTLELDFQVVGDETHRAENPVIDKGESWVMK